MSFWANAAVWGIGAGAIAGILLRPWGKPEWFWAVGGAALLVALRFISLGAAVDAIARGTDVYAFLIGIMALAELARREHLFAWGATVLLRRANGSQPRLFALVYAVGAVVTVLLSNDTTVVVLTPAVVAALSQTDADPLPYLFGCAFIANAASFVLPISNPANLVVFDGRMPTLLPWLAAFGAASVAAIGLTFGVHRMLAGGSLRRPFRYDAEMESPSSTTMLAGVLVGSAAVLLVAAAALGWNLGLTALASAVAVTAILSVRNGDVVRSVALHVAWQIVPLVAGLFVIVRALSTSGATDGMRHLMAVSGPLSYVGNLVVAVGITAADNIFNNLPVALAAGYTLSAMPVAERLVNVTLVAVDLGPNLTVAGSLATLLWLIALRRAGIVVTPLQFLRLGAIVTLPALLAACLLVR